MSQTNTLTTPTQNQIPIVNTTFVESTIIVQDGVSVILGGLRRDDYAEDNQGIPILMDVPILGHLFKNRDESLTRSEIVIFITPHIVDGSTHVGNDPIPIKPDMMESKSAFVFNASHIQNHNEDKVDDIIAKTPDSVLGRSSESQISTPSAKIMAAAQ